MKEYTENELRNKAEVYCLAAERCPSEVEAKLQQWGASPETSAHILEHLQKERFVDTARFCRAFVRDKYRFNQWGRMKIIQALRMKQLSSEAMTGGIAEIDEEEYRAILQKLLQQKARSISARNDYERNAKLIRFACGKGFLMEEILPLLPQTDGNEYPCDHEAMD